MKLSNVKRVSREDVAKGGGELPKWLDALMEPINAFIERVTVAVNGNLTFTDNFLGKRVQVELTHDVAIEVNAQIIGKPSLRVEGVMLLDAAGLDIDRFQWSRNQNGNVTVKIYVNGGSSTTKATCTLFVLLGG